MTETARRADWHENNGQPAIAANIRTWLPRHDLSDALTNGELEDFVEEQAARFQPDGVSIAIFRYSKDAPVSVSVGATTRNVEPTVEAVERAIEHQRASIWNRPDGSTSATGKPYFESDD